jgi:hypothetical protein
VAFASQKMILSEKDYDEELDGVISHVSLY